MMSTDDILQRFYAIEKSQTDPCPSFEMVLLENKNIVFRETKGGVFWGKVGMVFGFGIIAALIILLCAQIYPVLTWLLYPCLFVALRYLIGGTATEQQTILFQINIPERKIFVPAVPYKTPELQIEIDAIRDFYEWHIEDASDSHNNSVRCTVGKLEEVAILR